MLDRGGVPFFLGPRSGCQKLGMEFGQPFGRHLAGLHGVRDTGEGLNLKPVHRFRKGILHWSRSGREESQQGLSGGPRIARSALSTWPVAPR